MANSPRTNQPQAAQPAAPTKAAAPQPDSEIMLSIARSLDGRWRVVIGQRDEAGAQPNVVSKGWTSRSEALADLARAIPRLQRFLTRSPKRAADGVEARS